MTTPLPPTAAPSSNLPPPPPATQVAGDVPCRKCSYNLRTLSPAGFCPECGTPVAVSIYGNLLRFSDPAWLQKLRKGALYIVAGVLVGIGAVIVGMIFGALATLQLPSRQVLIQFLALGGNVLVVLGTWFLTEPDPSGIGEDEYGTARKVIRITLLLGIMNTFLGFVSSFSVFAPTAHQLIMVISGLFSIANIVGLIAQLQYCAKLAARIPDQALTNRANFLKIALSSVYGFLVVFGIVVELTVYLRGLTGPNAGFMIAAGCFAGLVGLAALVFFVMYLFMMDKFRRRFGEQAAYAEQVWAGHPHSSGPA
jgi:hypothetical protein